MPVLSFAQDCAGYYFLQTNKTIEMTLTDKKGKPTGKAIYRVSDVTNSGGAVTAKVKTETFDKKGKSMGTGNSTMVCENGRMKIDMQVNIPVQNGGKGDAGAMTGAAKAEDMYVEYPSSMKAGDELKDAHCVMEVEVQKGMTQKITMDVTNRKVEGKERITTPAGSWDCFKITSRSKIRMEVMGIGVPVQLEQSEWFAPDFGVVKSANEHGGTEITSIN
jgi:hypothetical protein